MGFLKQLVLDDIALQHLKVLRDIQEFIGFIEPYYPDLKVNDYTIEEIEMALYHIFFKLIGKIISFSPLNMRRFLKDYLLKYEIMNIKQIILGLIIGMTNEEKSKNVNFLIEEYLENTDFIKKLIEISSLEEIQLYMKKTIYNKAIREGILYFKNNNEIFVLEAFLDQLYYFILLRRENMYNKKEKNMISLFNSFKTEIYNINLMYRGIINGIDKNLLSQFIVNNYLFLDENKINVLLDQKNLNDFFLELDIILRKIIELKYFINISEEEHPMWELERLYEQYYFKKVKITFEDIEHLTIYRILELIIKKEKEINLEIIPNVVRIINRKFKSL
ncbi:MAG: V-type ATPase subunit [Promethearchaeota archaeon]